MIRSIASEKNTDDPRAENAGLVYVSDFDEGISRHRCGKGFIYRSSQGNTIKSKKNIQRIKSLAIPPAWEDVWICADARGHIQSRGKDDAGRLQYIYHEHWQEICQTTKFDRMETMAKTLPRLRRRITRDLQERKLTKKRVLAAAVRLLDKVHIRIGNECYAEQNGSRGATTLMPEHVDVHRFRITLDFPGKSGQQQEIEFSDAKVAKVIRECAEIDGQFLFCYRDEAGSYSNINSTDVNQYLREASRESITSKDFRTWWASVLALSQLADLETNATKSERKRAVSLAIETAAKALGNTKTVCRNSYIHPGLLTAAESGELAQLMKRVNRSEHTVAGLRIHESLFAKLLLLLESSRK